MGNADDLEARRVRGEQHMSQRGDACISTVIINVGLKLAGVCARQTCINLCGHNTKFHFKGQEDTCQAQARE